MRGWIECNPDGRCHSDGLVYRTGMSNPQQSFPLICRDAVRQMDSDVDTTDTMRTLGRGPFCIHAEAISINAVPRTELPDEIRNTTCDGTDKEFHRTHPGILPPILDRLVGDDSMLAAHNVVPCPSVIGCGELHLTPEPGSFAAPHKHSRPSGNAMSSPLIPIDP